MGDTAVGPFRGERRRAAPAMVALAVVASGLGLGYALGAHSAVLAGAAVAGVVFTGFAIARMDLALLAIVVARGVTNLLPGQSGTALDTSAALLVFITVMGAAYLLAHRVDVFRAPTIVPQLAFVALALLASVFTPGRTFALPIWARLAAFLIVFLLAWHTTRTRADLWRLLGAIVFAGVLTSFSAIRDFATGATRAFEFEAQLGLPRVEGAFASGLGYGTYLFIPLVLALVLYLEARSRRSRVTLAAALAVLGPAFLLSFARMPWIGFAAAVLVLGAYRYRALPVALAVGALVLVLAVPGVRVRFATALAPRHEMGSDLVGRVERWHAAANLFLARPLLGFGLGVGEVVATAIATRGQVDAGMLHSDYFRVLVDTGVLGALAFLWVLLAVAGALWGAVLRTRDPTLRAVPAAALAVWIGMLLVRITGNVLTFTPPMFLLWALVGAALAAPQIQTAAAAHDAPARDLWAPLRARPRAPVPQRSGGAV